MNYREVDTDVLIIGAGGAGLRAAIEALSKGARVAVVSKSLLGKAHTVMAEGGIAAALGNVDPEDSWEVHFSDTIVEGVYIVNWRMAEILAKEALDRVYELERYGALFDRTPEGKIMQRAFGAHTYRRLCHVGDKTGLELIRTFEDKILHTSGAQIFDEFFVTKLFRNETGITGAMGFSIRTGELIAFSAKAVIIATGGLGRLYKVTSNSWESTGDGIALAFRIGATLMDMEMIQFHPTGMVWPPGAKGLLVTEGVRGEGGILLNAKGERFMLRYSPERKELDARDVVARAIYNEIEIGNGTEHGGVYLDITHKGPAFIKKKLPTMYEQFRELAGVDITKEKMEVAPTVHYFMGGLEVGAETCSTDVVGMYACGEAAGGLHGANRLGGNSLADILVFGRRAGAAAADYSKGARQGRISSSEIEAEISRIKSYLRDGAQSPHPLIEELRTTMSEKVGIIRDERGLSEALDTIRSLKERSKSVGVVGSIKFNHGLMSCFELENMLTLAECIVLSASERKESRGAHTRADYPKKDRKFKLNILCRLRDSRVELSTKEITEMPDYLKKLVKEEVY